MNSIRKIGISPESFLSYNELQRITEIMFLI